MTSDVQSPADDATEIARPLRWLLYRLMDYAGLFPPAKLGMAPTVSSYAKHLAGPHGWMVGRLIIPAARLDEFEEAAKDALPRDDEANRWHISALTKPADDDTLADDLHRIYQFNEDHHYPRNGAAIIDTIELKARGGAAIDAALAKIPDVVYPYFELPVKEDPRGLIASLAGSEAGAKIRTGGVTADLFPTTAEVARFIAACAASDVPFKATAGLHHPIRHFNESVNTKMHGFFNVFAAACVALGRDSNIDALTAVLEEESPGAFQFGEDELTCGEHVLSIEAIQNARANFAVSFGSCSIDEPVEDLQTLSLL